MTQHVFPDRFVRGPEIPCAKCGRRIPDGLLACPHCTRQRSVEAMRRYQLERVLQAAEGNGQFIIHKKPSGNHAQMWGPHARDGRARAFFCGGQAADFNKKKELVLAPEIKRGRLSYGAKGWALVCEKCRESIEELLVEARTAEAMRNA